jgi:nicotinamidase/pyrazinamidase
VVVRERALPLRHEADLRGVVDRRGLVCRGGERAVHRGDVGQRQADEGDAGAGDRSDGRVAQGGGGRQAEHEPITGNRIRLKRLLRTAKSRVRFDGMPEALLIIDYQNDFAAPDGALSVAGGDAIAPRINELARDPRFALVAATRDWHPPDHHSFAAQGGPWPVHCVQGTPGADFHPSLDRTRIAAVVDAGSDADAPGYSGFERTDLEQILREHDIDAVTVVGLATDYCVKETALDALGLGFAVTVDQSAVRPVEVTPGDGQRALDEIAAAGGTIV